MVTASANTPKTLATTRLTSPTQFIEIQLEGHHDNDADSDTAAIEQLSRIAAANLPDTLVRIANTEDAQDWIHPEQTSHTANPDDILADAADQGVRIRGGRTAIQEILETIRREAGKCRHCGCELTTDLVDVGVCAIPQGPPYCQPNLALL